MKWNFAINLYDLLFLGTISTGLTFSVLLFLVKRINQKANRFLGLVLLIIVLWMVWVLSIDIHLSQYFPRWSWVPLQYSLSIGPLIYFYIRKLLNPERRFKLADWLHFFPLIFEQGVLIVEVLESRRTAMATFDTKAFLVLNPVVQALALISVLSYVFLSFRQLRNYHELLAEQFSDADRYQYRWLQRLLVGFGLLWLLWAPFITVDFVFYHYSLSISSYYPLYLLLSVMIVWTGAEVFLRPEFVIFELPIVKPSFSPPSDELQQLTGWLEAQIEANLFHHNAGLTLRELAEALEVHPNELSRIINSGTGKNFNDFINTYRIEEVKRKMLDPIYDHITLLGIAFDCGFNSKTTFNRTFKNMTGQSPAEYKSSLKTVPIL